MPRHAVDIAARTLRILMCVVLVSLSLVTGGKAVMSDTGAAAHSWYQDSLSNHMPAEPHGHFHDHGDLDPDRQIADHHEHLEPIHDVMPALNLPGSALLDLRQAWLALPDDRARSRFIAGPYQPPSV